LLLSKFTWEPRQDSENIFYCEDFSCAKHNAVNLTDGAASFHISTGGAPVFLWIRRGVSFCGLSRVSCRRGR
jgi:hypothetical protein